MRLRIALDGREREVAVEGDGPDVRVRVDGREIPVRVSVEENAAIADVEGRQLRLEFGGGLRIDGVPRLARVTWVAEEAAREGAAQVVDVKPPMPGRIVRVLAKPGDAVRRGAPLVILEAMKMQNEIPAPDGGVVQDVRVREGDLVTANDVLVRLGKGRSA
ncbi:MAG: biotin attachment protein [Euryarchaeota archaeon]|nr:biotin attachment protein [Euryarchaeota archaeon]